MPAERSYWDLKRARPRIIFRPRISEMSTLLSDLEGSPPKDGDLVDQILKEMNTGPSPASSMQAGQMSNTAMSARMMDPAPATAHVIGNSQPTPGDFAAAIHGTSNQGSQPQAAGQGQMYAPAPTPTPSPVYHVPSKRTLTQRFGEEFKIPILVAVLVFVFSLPVVNFLFAHYLPSMVLPTGQLKTLGLLIKSLAAGVSFWVMQRVIVPLFSL
jgi:hypothetical protein